jgi:uncharacterized membrane protein
VGLKRSLLKHWPLVGLLLAFDFALGGLLSWNWHQLRFGAYDLGIHDQVLYLYSRTIFVPSSFTHLPAPFWDSHFRPTFIVFFLQYLFLPSPLVFILLQVLIYSLGAIPIYLLTIRYLKSKLFAFSLSFAYLAYPGALSALAYPGHSENLVAALVSFALYYYLIGRKRLFFLFFLLASLSQENISLYLSGLSLFLMLKKDYKLAAAAFLVSAGYGLVVIKYLIPAGLGRDYIFTSRYFDSFTGFAPLFAHPDEKLRTIGLSLASFGFLPLLTPALLAAPALSLLVRFLSFRQDLWRMYYHYSVFLTPFLAYACLLGMKFLLEKKARLRRVGGTVFSLLLLAAPLVINVKFGYFKNNYLVENPLSRAELARIHSLLAMVPDYASVSAQDPVIPLLTHREEVYSLHEYHLADYIPIDLALSFAPLTKQDGVLLVRQLMESRRYHVVYCSRDNILLKRGHETGLRPDCAAFMERLKWV